MSYRYAILGTGALGGFYGARLQRAGCEVHFLLHSDVEYVRKHGLRVDSVDGNFVLPRVHAHATVATIPPCDVAVVALKTTHNNLLPDLLPPLTEQGAAILVMQNGLGVEDEAARAAGDVPLLGGLAFLCSNKLGPGHIHHLDYGAVMLGSYRPDHQPGGVTSLMKTIGADFTAAGLPVTLNEDLQNARWRKLVWNIPFNGLSVLHRMTTTELLRTPATRERAIQLMGEVLAGARACGHLIEAAFADKMLRDTEKMAPYRPSMLLDLEAGRPMEIEAIFGNPLRAAERAGTRLAGLAQLYRELKAA